jgi:hypothetical protein
MAESGLAGQETELVIGLVAPARTPPSIVELLARRVVEFVGRPQTQERLAVFGFTAVGSTPGNLPPKLNPISIERLRLFGRQGSRSIEPIIEELDCSFKCRRSI